MSYTLFLLCALFVLINAEDSLKIEVVQKVLDADCTRKAQKDDMISMHYTGKLLATGAEFDSSYSRKQPFDFKLGSGQVIAGWDEGIPGMCKGEKRKLTIPAHLAYGDQGFGTIIPAGSSLVFDIELVDIKDDVDSPAKKDELVSESDEHEHPDSFEAIDANNDKKITSEEMTSYIKKFNEEGTEEKFENIDTIVSEIFQEDDKNKDGVISYEEYQHYEDMDEGGEQVDPEAPQVEEEDEEEEEEDDGGLDPNDIKESLKEEL